MPRDGSFPDLSSEALAKGEITLEEKALRHALAFFSDESKWAQRTFENDEGGICIGRAFINFLRTKEGDKSSYAFEIGTRALGTDSLTGWNDSLSNLAALKAHLRTRIEYYTGKRLKNSYLVVVGPGRRVKE